MSKTVSKEDSIYFNSKQRVAKQLISLIIQYIIMFVIATMINGMIAGNFDPQRLPDTIVQGMSPGGFIFTVMVSALPLIVIGCAVTYFGLGSWERMVMRLIRLLAVFLWFYTIAYTSGVIDLMNMSTSSIADTNNQLQEFLIDLRPFVKLIGLCIVFSTVIPVIEFLLTRKDRQQAIQRRNQ